MIKVFTAQDIIEVFFWKNYLEQHDIPCEVRNEYLGGVAGEVPPIECWPELWVNDSRDEQRARAYLRTNPLENIEMAHWTCANCGEQSEGQFSSCWQCGTEREENE